MNIQTEEFLRRHGLMPDLIDPPREAEKVCSHMRSGIAGHVVDMPMIRTFLSADGAEPYNRNVIVIDAGGTNYRCGLASFSEAGCEVKDVRISKMPGTDASATWEEFISFVADSIEPFIALADSIGFCFSYSAEITPEKDGLVNDIDKEVIITGCRGKLIAASLNEELVSRGFAPKKIVILNDTVAALFGGSAGLDKTAFSDLCGMICGTGFNLCLSHEGMIYNTEAGFYDSLPRGDIDRQVDANSQQPGEKLAEKMISGAYIGLLCKAAIAEAAKEGLVSPASAEKVKNTEQFDGAVVSALASGCDELGLFSTEAEKEFARDLCLAVFGRSAMCVASVVIGVMLLNGSGKSAEKPACVCAEGSLIGKSEYFRHDLLAALDQYARQELGLHCEIRIGNGTTLPGSASAALLN